MSYVYRHATVEREMKAGCLISFFLWAAILAVYVLVTG